MKFKRILSVLLVLSVCVSCFGSLSMISFAVPGSDYNTEPWEWESQGGNYVPFAPYNQYVSRQNPPSFSWPRIKGAVKYDLIVCSDEALTDIKYEKRDIDVNLYDFPHTFEEGVIYYWAMRYNDGQKWSDWSKPRRFRIQPGSTVFTFIDQSEWADKIPAQHPRFFGDLEKYENIRKKDAEVQKAYDEIVADADKYLADRTLPPEECPGSKAEMQTILGATVKETNKLISLSAAYLLTQNKEYAKYAIDIMLGLAKWNPDGPSSHKTHDQANRQIAMDAATTYDAVYSVMTEDERTIVENMIVTRVKQFEYLFDSLKTSLYDSHGFTIVIYSAKIAVALYGEVPEATQWFKDSVQIFASAYPAWGYQDGGWSQGAGYGRLNADYYDVMLHLKSFGLVNIADKAALTENWKWFMYVLAPGNFTSTGDEAGFEKLKLNSKRDDIFLLYAMLPDDPNLKWLWEQYGGRYKGILKYYGSLLISDDTETEPPYMVPLANEFDDCGMIAMTNDVIDTNRISAIFRSSEYGSYNHSHPDHNSFFIQAYGEILAGRSGWYDSYHSTHDSNFTRKTGAHNSVTIATNRGQMDDTMKAKGKLTGFLTQTDFDLAAGDASQAYMGNLDEFERCMIYVRPDLFIVIDELDAMKDSEQKFEWWLNSPYAKFEKYSNGNGVRLQNNQAVLDTTVQYPKKVKTYYNKGWMLSDMKEYPISKPSSNNVRDDAIHQRVWFETEKVDRTKMVVTLDVHKAGERAKYVNTKYYDNYMKMNLEDGTVVFVNLQKSGMPVTTKEGITFDGTAVVYNDESIMHILGTSLKWGDTQLIRSEKEASVVMGKNELGISSYFDQKIEVNTKNDYINAEIEKATNEEGIEISRAYGITMENGKLVENSNVAEADKKIFTVEASDNSVVFDVEKDNYSLLLNGKKFKSQLLEGNIKLNVLGEGIKNIPINGYLRRDGTGNFVGTYTGDGRVYNIKSISNGIDFAKMQAGEQKSIGGLLEISSTAAEGEVVLEPVIVKDMSMDMSDDRDGVKNRANIFIEAENAIELESGAPYSTRKFMSGGAGVSDHNVSGTNIIYEVDVREEGDYVFSVNSVQWLDGGAKRRISIDGKSYMLNLARTDGWGSALEQWKVSTTKDTIHLPVGKHKLYIEASTGSWNIDWIAFTKK